MKCAKQVFLVALLMLLAVSPAFCGWPAFRNSSSDSSNGVLETTVPTDATEQSSMESSNEEKTETVPTEGVLQNLEVNSENYDAKLAEAKEVLVEAEKEVAEAVKTEKPKKAEEKKTAVEEAKVIVDELIASKAALDENYDTLADIALTQQKAINRLKRQEAFKFGAGLAFGYKPETVVSPGLALGLLFNEEWEVELITSYNIDVMKGGQDIMNFDFHNMQFMLTVKKFF